MSTEPNQHDSYVAEGGIRVVPKQRTGWDIVKMVLKPLSSLQLTVTLFALSMVLVFYGTMAQRTGSTFTATEVYFRSNIVWIPNQLNADFLIIFFGLDKETKWPYSLPFPGGWTLGAVFLVNLLAAHLVRFKLSWKRSGIIVVHLGIALMFLGELFTGLYSVESHMQLEIGEAVNFIDVSHDPHHRVYELAFTKIGDPKYDEAVVIPQSLLVPGHTVSHPDLPVDVEVLEYWKNSDYKMLGPMQNAEGAIPVFSKAMQANIKLLLTERGEVAGSEGSAADAPAVLVNLIDKNTGAKAKQLLSLWTYANFSRRQFTCQPVVVERDGEKYEVGFRNRRIYLPYTLKLLNFEHKTIDGTDMAKDFASEILLNDPEMNDHRQQRVYMNHPMRYRDLSYFQHAFLLDDRGTILEVNRNPVRIFPYISCGLVSLGLLIQFGLGLARSQQRRAVK